MQLLCMSRKRSDWKAYCEPQAAGRLPEKLQLFRYRCVRLDSPLSDQLVGSIPSKRLKDRSRKVRDAGGSPNPKGTGPSKLHGEVVLEKN